MEASMVVKFEFLPNELLFECFKYLNAIEIFYAFDQLNSRFNRLIRTIPLCLDFQYARKSMFNQFCTKMQSNPQIKHQIYSLYLVHDNSCTILDHFLSDFPLNEFIHLHSLTTIEINSHITQRIHSILVLLPELKAFHFIHSDEKPLKMSTIRTFSSHIIYNSSVSSLVYLTIPFAYTFTLCAVFKNAPMLKYLNVECLFSDLTSNHNKNLFIDIYAMHLKQLIIKNFQGPLKDFEQIAKQIPNLKSLTLCVQGGSINLINADRWENLIKSFLPQLIVFQFKFIVTNKYDILDKFQEFQNDFWINQHHWYTAFLSDNSRTCLYTIPYLFNTYLLTSRSMKNSNPLMININPFDNITDLIVQDTLLTVEHNIYFPNVKSLRLIHKPMNKIDGDPPRLKKHYVQCLKRIMNLSHLKHLSIEWNSRTDFSSILLDILKQSSLLSTLTIPLTDFGSWYSNYHLCKYLKQQIKTLTICQENLPKFLYRKELEWFCEVFASIERLICSIDNADQLLFLLKHLTKLEYMRVWIFSASDIDDWSMFFQKNFPELDISLIDITSFMNETELCIWINHDSFSSVCIKRSTTQMSSLSSEESDLSRQTSSFFRRFLCICSSKRRYSSSLRLIPRDRSQEQID